MKPTQLLILAGAAVGGFFLFNSFKGKETVPVIPTEDKWANVPKVKLIGTKMYYQYTKKGLTTAQTTVYDKNTYQEKAKVNAGITLSISGAINTDKGQMYITTAGYIPTKDISITDHGTPASTL